MIILKKHAMNKNKCWPSHRKIAEEIKCCESSVKKAINKLENKNILTINKDKKHRSNTYNILSI